MRDITWRKGFPQYLINLGITEEAGGRYVRPILSYTDNFFKNDRTQGPILAYNYSKDGSFGSFKRCTVRASKWKWFWFNKTAACTYFPYDILDNEEQGESLFIVGGEKDVLTMLSNGYKAICLNSETATLSQDLFRDMARRYKKVYVMYDIDSTGIKCANAISSEFQVPMVTLPSTVHVQGENHAYGNDVTELFNYNQEGYKPSEVLERAIEEATIIGPRDKRVTVDTQMNEIYKISEEIRSLKSGRVDFPPPLIKMRGEYASGFIFPYTINVIQGQNGVHKSRFAEIIGSLLLSVDDHPYPDLFLGMEKDNRKYHVVYVDTERNIRHQLPYTIQGIQERAGIPREVDPENFSYITLLHEERGKRMNLLQRYLKEIREDKKGFLVVILDVITDCIGSFNDSIESNKLIDMINVMVNDEECTIICVIHENPGQGQKARGHLGTEIVNKASGQFSISWDNSATGEDNSGKKNGHIVIRNEKNRLGRIIPEILASYDPDLGSIIGTAKKGLYNRESVANMLRAYSSEQSDKTDELPEKEVVKSDPIADFESEKKVTEPKEYLKPVEVKTPEPERIEIGNGFSKIATSEKDRLLKESEPFGSEVDDLPF